jgi:hypothetical protein
MFTIDALRISLYCDNLDNLLTLTKKDKYKTPTYPFLSFRLTVPNFQDQLSIYQTIQFRV